MPKIRLGGIKVFEKRACLFQCGRDGAHTLGDICSRLALDRINLGLLIHVADFEGLESITAASMKSIDSAFRCASGKISPEASDREQTLADAYRISIFPHDQRPDVTALLVRLLADKRIKPYAVGSSPSAMTVIVSSSDFQTAMEGIFDVFAFHAFDSYAGWQAACGGRAESLLKYVRLPFHEEIITIYDFEYRAGLDLWRAKLPLGKLRDFAAFLSSLDSSGLRMPFLVSASPSGEENISFSFLFEAAHHDIIEQTPAGTSSGLFRLGPVSVFFLHGPHFGDRYGIANALVKSLRGAGVPLLALSCAVSSISLVVRSGDSDQTIRALDSVFKTPSGRLAP